MNKKGFSLVEILITAVVLCFVAWYAAKNYMGDNGGTGTTIDSASKQELAKEGVKTDNGISMEASAKAKVDEYNKKSAQRQAETAQGMANE